MIKVLILDERVERKKTHMNEDAIIKLSDCENRGYLTMITGEGLEKDSSFNYCADYSLLAFHKSWLDTNSLTSDFILYAKSQKKLIVLFSGGISQMLLLDNFKHLRMNSANFYTERLPDFIERYVTSNIEQPLLQLLYGEAWRLPIYMKYRSFIWKGISNEDIDYSNFELNFAKYISEFNISSIETIGKLNKAISGEIIKSKTI